MRACLPSAPHAPGETERAPRRGSPPDPRAHGRSWMCGRMVPHRSSFPVFFRPTMTTQRRAEVWLSLIVCGAYVVCGQLVQNAYPFSSFPMYARISRSASRILARNAAGTVSETATYAAWKCSAFTLSSCEVPPESAIVYRDREALDAVNRSSPGGGHPRVAVDLVRRTDRFTPAFERHDCVMAHCTAEKR